MDEKIKIVIDGQKGDVIARSGGIRRVDFSEANPNLALVRVRGISFFVQDLRDIQAEIS